MRCNYYANPFKRMIPLKAFQYKCNPDGRLPSSSQILKFTFFSYLKWYVHRQKCLLTSQLSKGFLLTLLASSLVAAQTVPDLNGDCVNQCSGLTQLNNCVNAQDYTCACKIYESVLPGAVRPYYGKCFNCTVYQLLEFGKRSSRSGIARAR